MIRIDTATAGPAATRTRDTVFLLLCRDGAGAARLRAEHMSGHLRHIEQHIDRYIVAGPAFVDPPADPQTIHASVLVVRADDEPSAHALLEGDPYYRNGVWSSVEVISFRAVCGEAVGGITWAPLLERNFNPPSEPNA